MTARRVRKQNPREERLARIRQAFDPAALVDLCVRQDFTAYAPRFELASTPEQDRFFHYRDNGSNILAVAHLDSVQPDGTCTLVDTTGGLLALSGALDDRLGVCVILELLPALGVTVDWLLTTDEEIGESTAAAFHSDKSYNWMFQFDRGGTDVVLYDFETPDLVARVEAAGARVGIGSFSDICLLEHLGCVGLNWGVGYRDYHSPRSHAWLEDTFTMVDRFLRFYRTNRDLHLAHVPALDWVDFGLNDETCRDCGRSANQWQDWPCPYCEAA